MKYDQKLVESTMFDVSYYLEHNPDIAGKAVSPWLHYILYGFREGRSARYRLDLLPEKSPLLQLGPPLVIDNHFYPSGILKSEHVIGSDRILPLHYAVENTTLLLRLVANEVGASASKKLLASEMQEVLLVSGEPNTSGHYYRIELIADAFERLGLSPKVVNVDNECKWESDLISPNTRLLYIWRLRHSLLDSRILQMADYFECRFIFDVDDYMFNPRLVDNGEIDAIRYLGLKPASIKEFYADINRLASTAYYITTPTQFLSRKAKLICSNTSTIPNSFSGTKYAKSQFYAKTKQVLNALPDTHLFRIGYLGGSLTHQKDFSQCADAVAEILANRDDCRLVIFRDRISKKLYLDLSEFPTLERLSSQIEIRDSVPHDDLPSEISRLHINLAPLELNDYCHSKSELKYFEAAICGVPTIASPTETYMSCIKHGFNGFLASTTNDWLDYIALLLDDLDIATAVAKNSLVHSILRYSPSSLCLSLYNLLVNLGGHEEQNRSRHLGYFPNTFSFSPASTPDYETIYSYSGQEPSGLQVSMVIPNYNYSSYIIQCLDSIKAQTHPNLELIICDDCSTDNSIDVIVAWAQEHRQRFNRLIVTRNNNNSGLGATRNLAVELSSSFWYMPVDPDNLIAVNCIKACLAKLLSSDAEYCYPLIRQFGDGSSLMGDTEYSPSILVEGNVIDAMALVSIYAYHRVGGYYDSKRTSIPNGWEDYDFWCKCVEHDIKGVSAREYGVQAFYRVHQSSMLATESNLSNKNQKLVSYIREKHPWTQPISAT